eukprot:2032835-Rhodomonas_salina.1
MPVLFASATCGMSSGNRTLIHFPRTPVFPCQQPAQQHKNKTTQAARRHTTQPPPPPATHTRQPSPNPFGEQHTRWCRTEAGRRAPSSASHPAPKARPSGPCRGCRSACL